MNDIRFNCPACNQSIEAPPEMGGRVIDCPTCKKSIKTPLLQATSTNTKHPFVSDATVNNRSAQGTVQNIAMPFPPSCVSPQSSKRASLGALTSVFLTLVGVGLLGGLFYFIKANYGRDITVNGEVFIVTKSGQSIKCGLVEVALIPRQTMKPYLENKYREACGAKAHAFLSENGKDLSISSSFYFQSMPPPLRITKTNSDGKFRLLVPTSEPFILAAMTSRNVGNTVEEYCWIIKIDSKAGKTQEIMLSNDNMLPHKISLFPEALK